MVKKILMVCLGNICRSPIAEAVMQHVVDQAGKSSDFVVASAALGAWHTGNPPDHRALATMKNHGLVYNETARPLTSEDYNKFDYIFGMDDENIRDLKKRAPKNAKAKILLLGDFGLDPSDRIIVDPYYERGSAGFEKAYEQSVVACKAVLTAILENKI